MKTFMVEYREIFAVSKATIVEARSEDEAVTKAVEESSGYGIVEVDNITEVK